MKSLLTVSALALLLMGCGEIPTASVVADVKPGVVFIANKTGESSGGIGSGFILEDNQIITNHHVINNTQELLVFSGDTERRYKAKVVFKDEVMDIAIIELEDWDSFNKNEGHTNLHLGDSDAMRVGQKVIVIGHPSGLSWTVSQGILSAKDRRPGGNPRFLNQIDANLYQGNSGGPIFDARGNVVCVSNMMLTMEGGSYGFCIPSILVKKALYDYKAFGEVRWRVMNVAAGLTDDGSSVILQSVEPDGAAAKAGLKEGDKVLMIYTPNNHPEGVKVDTPNELITEMAKMLGDDEMVILLIDRNGEKMMIDVKTNYRLSAEYAPDRAK